MALRRLFFNVMRTELFPSVFESLDGIREFVGRAAQDAGLDEKAVYGVQLATDEACSNIIEHAYAGASDQQIEVTCNVQPDRLTVILRDRGRKFEPTLVPEPVLTGSIEDREIGGLGLHFIRKLMDEVQYESDPQIGNVLTLIKRKAEG